MAKLHMVGGRTLEVVQDVNQLLSIKKSSWVNLIELVPTHGKHEEHPTRDVIVNTSNILYISE